VLVGQGFDLRVFLIYSHFPKSPEILLTMASLYVFNLNSSWFQTRKYWGIFYWPKVNKDLLNKRVSVHGLRYNTYYFIPITGSPNVLPIIYVPSFNIPLHMTLDLTCRLLLIIKDTGLGKNPLPVVARLTIIRRSSGLRLFSSTPLEQYNMIVECNKWSRLIP